MTLSEQRMEAKTNPAPFVSVIIPVYNNANGLALALQALERQTYPRKQFETIVVDNGSVDDIKRVRICHPDEVLWLSEKEKGSYRARNRGIRAARGEVLAFTDSDCIPDGAWLERGVRAVLASEKIGLVAGRVEFMFERPRRPSACELYDSLCSLQQEETIRLARFGAAANLFTTRQVMQRVGLFDDRRMSGGDREWGNRVFGFGLKQIYCAQAAVRHPAKRTLGGLIQKSLRVTVATMAAGPDAAYSSHYFRRHLLHRPRGMWQRMAVGPSPVPASRRLKVLGLYYLIKALQIGERGRVLIGGSPRR